MKNILLSNPAHKRRHAKISSSTVFFFATLALATSNLPTAASAALSIPPLVSTEWVAQNHENIKILDIANTPNTFTEPPDLPVTGSKQLTATTEIASHIPGAVLFDINSTRVNRKIGDNNLPAMSPTAEEFERLAQNAGINQNDAILIVTKGVDNEDLLAGARLYWIFKRYGQKQIALMNGGMKRWLEERRPTSIQNEPKPAKGDWRAKDHSQLFAATADETSSASQSGSQLVDARESSDYRKHIRGAANFPPEELAPAPGGIFATAEQYRSALNKHHIDPDAESIVYCKGGKLSPGTWFIMSEILGNHRTRIFEGAMRQWEMEKRPTSE